MERRDGVNLSECLANFMSLSNSLIDPVEVATASRAQPILITTTRQRYLGIRRRGVCVEGGMLKPGDA